MSFRRIGGSEAWKGKTFTVREDRFEHDDGDQVTREIVCNPAAVAVVAHDGERLYLLEHAREVVGEQALLELPAGKVDEGEAPQETAVRELAEEIGKGARNWEHLTTCYASPGFTDEQLHIYLATDLYDADTEPDESERMELRLVPLDDLDAAIRDCHDAKTLVGLLWLRAFRR
jgi:ADP-ribose pyrophosphatase